MTAHRISRRSLGAAAGALALTLTSCGGGAGGAGQGSSGPITIGYLPSWSDTLTTAFLWEHILTEQGYEVEMLEVAEAAPLFAALAGGDVDLYTSVWPQVTHASYMDEYGEDIEDLGAYNDQATNLLAVPEYTDIDSIDQLAENPAQFNNEIIGIEAGAGLMETTQSSVMPAYGLEDAGYSLVGSSTVAMLSELQSALDNQRDIVVTLWTPYWATTEFPVKPLEDPEGAFGEPETMNIMARSGFTEEHSELAEMAGNLQLDMDTFGDLEGTITNDFEEGQEREAVDAWLAENPDFIENLR